MKYLDGMKAAGKNPYLHKFHVTITNAEYVEKYGGLENGAHVEDVQESLSGRGGEGLF